MASNREQDMMQLQQDAVRRVMEMQRQAQARVHPEREKPPSKPKPGPKPDPPPPPSPKPEKPKNPEPRPETKLTVPKSGLLDGILSSTGLDKEQLLLLGLGYLLYKDGADHKLLLAILYLLL